MNKQQLLRHYRRLLFTLFFAASMLMLSACSDDDSPEQQVREFVAGAIEAAENREALALRDMIADDYLDARGNNRRNISSLAFGYLMRNNNINLFSQISNIHFPSSEQADVQLYLAMTGQPVTSIDSVFNLRADLFLFELKLVKRDGDWLLNNARWQRVRADQAMQ
jgi:hypothetical protein